MVNYDPEADATYVSVSNAAVASTNMLSTLVAVDLDEVGAPVGIELLKAPGAVTSDDEKAVLARYPGLAGAFDSLHRATAQPA